MIFEEAIGFAHNFLVEHGFTEGQEQYHEFYKAGFSHKVIRLGQNQHFMDFFTKDDNPHWEGFLSEIVQADQKLPEEKRKNWQIAQQRQQRSQLFRFSSKQFPQSEEQIEQCCKDFVAVYNDFCKNYC